MFAGNLVMTPPDISDILESAGVRRHSDTLGNPSAAVLRS